MDNSGSRGVIVGNVLERLLVRIPDHASDDDEVPLDKVLTIHNLLRI